MRRGPAVSESGRRFPLTLQRLTPRRGAAGDPGRSGFPPRSSTGTPEAVRAAQGYGLDSAAVRDRMIERLRAQGIEDERVLRAMAAVPRHAFVDAGLAAQAYEDTSLPIGWEQTISKPIVVARMLQLLAQAPGAASRRVRAPLGRALEVGTGCGYQAAVMRALSTRVTSIERIGPLLEKARAHLAALRLDDIRLVHRDGRLGHAPNAPYDSIVAAAGGDELPPAWLEQLAVGGRLVAPLHDVCRGGQMLVVIDKTEDGLQRSIHDAVRFVPLKSGHL